MTVIETKTDTFAVGDYIAPTWSAGRDRRGVVTKLEPKSKHSVEQVVTVKWLVGRTEEDRTTSKVDARKVELVWRPEVGDEVRLKGQRKKSLCQITKIHDDGELQLQPEEGVSFKAGLDTIVIRELHAREIAPEPELQDICEEEEAVARACGALEPEADAEEANPFDYVPIDPVPVWFKNGSADEMVEGQAIAKNGKEYFRVAYGDSEADLPAERLYWENPLVNTLVELPNASETVDSVNQSYAVGDRVSRSQHEGTITAIDGDTLSVLFDNNQDNAVHIPIHIAPRWLVKLPHPPTSPSPHPPDEYPIGAKVRLQVQVFGESREAFGTIVPISTIGKDGEPTTIELEHQIGVEYECRLPPIESVHEYYKKVYPADGVFRATGQIFKANVQVLKEEDITPSSPDPEEDIITAKTALQPGFQSVALSLITIDADIQPRVVLDEHAIEEYAEAMQSDTWEWSAERDPMVGYWDSTTLWLSSGGHRYRGAVRAGLQTVWVDVRLGDRSDALLNAPGANMRHGVKMSPADKNRAIALVLRDPKWQQESSRSLARLFAERGFRVDHKKIEQIRKGLMASGEMPQIEQRVVRRGDQTYTTKAPAVKQDEHSLEEVQTLYAELGDFSVNGDPARPYKFECIGVLQRFKSLDEAYERFAWMRERVADRQKEYATTCVDCAKRVNLSEGAEFECSAFGRVHAVTDDPGASGCRYYRKKSWAADPAPPERRQPAAFEPFNPAIERPEPPEGSVVTGYSTKEGEEDLKLTGAVVAIEPDRLRLENGGVVHRDTAVLEPSRAEQEASIRNGFKQAIARWAEFYEDGWHETALENATVAMLDLLENYEF